MTRFKSPRLAASSAFVSVLGPLNFNIRCAWLAFVAGLAAASASAQTVSADTPVVILPPVNVLAPKPDTYTARTASSATKTDTPIMDTPASVQVVPHQLIQDQAATDVSQIARDASGVLTRGGGAQDNGQPWSGITIRGFNTDTVFRDGVRFDSYGSNSDLFTQQFANVESIEILKGPAAVLYGAVEPGGIVNIVTKQPLADPHYALEQQFGSYSFYRTAVDLTGPLNADKTLLYRLNMSYQDAGSPTDYVYDNSRFIAPVLEWKPSPDTDVKLELEYRHADFGQNYSTVPLLNGVPINTSVAVNYAGQASPDKEDTYFAALTWSHRFGDDWAVRQKIVAQIIDQNSLGVLPSTILAGVTTPSGYGLANELNSVTNSTA